MASHRESDIGDESGRYPHRPRPARRKIVAGSRRNVMRIVHYLNSIDLRDGGVVRAVLDLCPGLAAAGHDVTLMTFNDRDVPEEWKRAGAGSSPRCVRIPAPSLPGGWLGAHAKSVVRDAVSRADVVHMHAMWIPSNEQVAAACRAAGVPYVWSPHGMLDDWCMAQKPAKKRVYHALLARRALEQAAFVHCTAEAELAQASKWFGRGRGMVVPLPFELSDYRNRPGPEPARAKFGLGPGEPTIAYVSRLHPKKGVDVLLRAAAALRDSGRPVRLVIAGGGDEPYVRSLHSLAAELSLGDRARFIGFVKGLDKVSLYQAADMFVLPSSQENFGYVVVEAMAAGTPVITTRGVALWPQLERERAAVLVEPSVQPLVAAIASLLDDPAAAREMGQRGREWCLKEMDPSRIIASFVDMYERAAHRRTSAGRAA